MKMRFKKKNKPATEENKKGMKRHFQAIQKKSVEFRKPENNAPQI